MAEPYDKPVGENRRHHLVPEHHLRRFADDRGRVVVVDRRDIGKSFTTSVKRATVERDFYAVERDGERRQDVEKLLAQLEGEGAGALRRMLEGAFPPDDDDRARIAVFLGAQWMRGRDMREAVNLVTGHMAVSRVMSTTRAGLQKFFREEKQKELTDQEADEVIAFAADPSRYTIEVHPHQHIRQMLEMIPGLANLACARIWQLLVATEGAFLTSDVPVTLWTHPAHRGPYGGGGFGPADELVFAVGRRHALVLAHEAPAGEIVREVGLAHVKEVNLRTATSGRRYIIHHPDDRPLVGMALPPPRPKFRVPPGPIRVEGTE